MKLNNDGNLGLHLIKCPNDKYSFFGSIPTSLMKVRIATEGDIRGLRAFKDDNVYKSHYTPVFDTENEALNYYNTNK